MKNWFDPNPVTQREGRAQLRGDKSAIWFLIFALFINLVVGYSYLDSYMRLAEGKSNFSIAQFQFELINVWYTLFASLTTLVIVVVPIISANSILIERQKKTLEVLLTSPISAGQFLFGKMLSSMRYAGVILSLSLPVATLTVILGGTSLSNLILCYALLFIHGLLFSAIGLAVASPKPRDETTTVKSTFTLLFAWVASFAFVIFSFISTTDGPGRLNNAGFNTYMIPLMVPQTLQTPIGEVPWFLVSGFLCIAVSFCFLAFAEANLENRNGISIVKQRISGLILAAGIPAYIIFHDKSSGIESLAVWHVLLGMAFVYIVPTISNFSMFSDTRAKFDHGFRFRNVFTGRPSGAGPYLILILASLFAGSVAGIYTIGQMTMFWPLLNAFTLLSGVAAALFGLSRYLSATLLDPVRAIRGVAGWAFFVSLAPFALLVITNNYSVVQFSWLAHFPIGQAGHALPIFALAGVFLIIGLLLASLGTKRAYEVKRGQKILTQQVMAGSFGNPQLEKKEDEPAEILA